MTSSPQSPPFQRTRRSTNNIMLQVVAGCIPGISIATWYFGYGVLLNVLLSIVFALCFEALAISLRSRHIQTTLADNSALVTAVLFGLTIPPGLPWWLLFLGIGFAILIAKHIYGGLGQNPFNPAMCGYLFLLLSFPSAMTSWHIPNDALSSVQEFAPTSLSGLQQSLHLTFPFLSHNTLNPIEFIDGLAMATPLIESKMAGTSKLLTAWQTDQSLFARSSETAWELVNIGYFLGGAFLLFQRVISWHIPVAIITTVMTISILFYSPGGYAIYGTPYLHLFGSATMIGAFFIATDPVSAATTNKGKLVYGVIIGLSIYGVRAWGSYLDSIAIAVLLGNFLAPLLDHFLRPRIYGHKKGVLGPSDMGGGSNKVIDS
jgi:electron transport complex protein RnfD